ncbi:hypothetical protein [Sphingomonas sp. DC2300-3]|uniref:hypothetical protein n=1 Tax=unclassified Sphingomonas TaxID=196159 RepID=UPI003CF9D05D
MTWLDHAAHVAGVLSLCVFAGAGIASAYAIIITTVPQWRRIISLAMGRIEVLYPEPQAASDAPHASAFPQHRVDEAVAVPALARARAGRSHPHAR